ncbi:PREDICTED: peptidyl-prolyl cis-trans isomerase CYP59 isoform X4 [Ipomoea nil]|uniref:peptidyl-prolyl cis-trans isomerase CYP59 isoform X3 n=1 Tax=Ipomoea nil TaxID=35883 RepID=UPI0009016D95|nr:PREDICTED: peptidyl-prolyl cis-trans isomerase CYP59 isoform X3 [Ipomoea nil]XP_019154883.1 PREDICTED: peptidyl-prolyl cis-trans isomerase CYP59 isoform X4 [Ipomoea nil]
MSVMIVTSLGDLVVDLFTDRCPLTCKNFLKLCKIKYYNGCLFHTVQKDFTAQTGDPTGTGSGGDSVYKFLYGDQARFFGDEIHLDLKHSKKGTVAMASGGENLNASQFYITLRDDLDYLDGKHTVFGEVAEGIDTLDRINEAFIDEKGRPFKNIRVKHTYILDDPFDDPPELVELIPDASPDGKPKDEVDDDVRLEDDWVPMDEKLGTQELEEILRAKEAHSRAVVLESIGDIPDAEIKPPDNVLFVCKLNPVTEDEDLYTIFSRFGTVTSAEIIRDYKTGDSLCYAFIEFEDKEACEQAYYKMDNALIDDRRIHVDFSQSVAKYWFQYRNRKDQMGKGGGCFKCGSLDHIAKDCTAQSTQQHHPKYILKEDNRQHGGDDNSRFEMVFDEDAGGSPRGNKRQQDYGAEKDDGKQNVKRRGSDEHFDRDNGKRELHDRYGHGHRSKENREDKYRGSRASPSRSERERDHRGSPFGDEKERSHRDHKYTGRRASPSRGERDRDHRARNDSDHRRKADHSHRERRDDTVNDKSRASPSRGERDRDLRARNDSDHRRKTDSSHRDRRDEGVNDRRRDNGVAHKDKRDEREHEKRDRRKEEGYNRRHADDVRHDKRDEQETVKKARKDEIQYDGRHADGTRHRDKGDKKEYDEKGRDDFGRKGREQERDHGKRSAKIDDACDGGGRRRRVDEDITQ